MFSGMDEFICQRNGKTLWISPNYLPDDVTDEDVLDMFASFDVVDIEIQPGYGAGVLFDTIRGAAEAERFFFLSARPQMMGGSMMHRTQNVVPTHQMAPMGPLMGMMHQMAPMGPPMGMRKSGSSLQRGLPSRPVQMHQPTLLQQGPCANIKVLANMDGSRRIISPPPSEAEAAVVEEKVVTGNCSLCKKLTSYTCGRCGIFYCSRECQKQSWPTHQTECNSKMPPLNFAGRRQLLTEMEINGCPVQRQLNNREGRQSPVGKQFSTMRNCNSTDVSQEQAKPLTSSGRNAGMKDERTQSSSLNRSSSGGNECRFDERTPHRGSSGSSLRPEQRDERRGDGSRQDDRPGRSFGTSQGRDFARNRSGDTDSLRPDQRDDRTGDGSRQDDRQGRSFGASQGRNFVRNRSDDTDRSPNTAASTPKSSVDVNLRSPRRVPNSFAAQQESAPGTVSPTKSSNTAANLLRNLKLNSPKAESSSNSSVTTPPDVPEEKFLRPESVSITCGSEVIITHVGDDCIYLQPTRDINQLAVVTNELKVHSSSVRSLQRQPTKKEFLAAKYSLDKAYYRAVVEKRLGEGVYEVQFVDFGNMEAGLTNADMVPITKGLAAVPCMAVKVCLKDVTDTFSQAALAILQSYFCGEAPLTVEFENDVAAGVTLFEKNGDSVNVKLLKAMGKLSSSPAAAVTPPAAPVVAAAAAASTPIAVVAAPTPAPAPIAVVAAPAPAPAPIPVVAAPVPVPVVYLPPIVPAPVQAEPTTAPDVAALAPEPVAAPVEVAPAPAPVVAAAAPTPDVAAPAPAPVVTAPAPAQVVAAPVKVAPAPAPVEAAPAPAPDVAAPAPAPVVAAPANRLFTIADVTYVPFPPVGSKCLVLLNHFHKDAGFFMACPVDMVAMELAAELGPKLETYAVNAQPFRPGPNELCIAKWTDGSWYRAVCLEHAGNDRFNVLFLEYGNSDIVPFPNIRPFTEEFVKYPALSSPCLLSEPSELKEAHKTKVQSMFKDEWVVEATVIHNSDGSCTLDIPELKNALA